MAPNEQECKDIISFSRPVISGGYNLHRPIGSPGVCGILRAYSGSLRNTSGKSPTLQLSYALSFTHCSHPIRGRSHACWEQKSSSDMDVYALSTMHCPWQAKPVGDCVVKASQVQHTHLPRDQVVWD